MKTIVLSDLHGYLPELEDFDLLIIPGDVCPTICHARSYQEKWLEDNFADWINNLHYRNEHSRVVMCAGNHDMAMEGISKKFKEKWLSCINDNRLVYVDNELYDFKYIEDGTEKHITLFGCPYCKKFGNWAFMRENLNNYYDCIPKGVDILFTHDAADIDNLGMILEGEYAGINAGNTVLAKYVNELKPKYYFCGHIHSGRHELKEINGVLSANVAIMNEDYRPAHEPLIINV